MNGLMLSEVAQILQAPLLGEDAPLLGVSTDTRQAVEGTLFIALKGENFDAHEVLDRHAHLPAAGLLVMRPVKTQLPMVVVPDTRRALGQLANAWRRRCQARLIALTGSNGKTTVKEMLKSIFRLAGPTLATQGNLNNDIGVPLTLLRLRPEDRYAVIEMGANHGGEIDYLTHLAEPDIALLNNAFAAHLEGFGSLQNVVEAKGEIFAGLRPAGVAVINADSEHRDYWTQLNPDRPIRYFGRADDSHTRLVGEDPLVLSVEDTVLDIDFALLGRHNAMNAAAAAAVASAAGIAPLKIRQGLEAVRPVNGRLKPLQHASGALILDDSYNANPASMVAGIEALAQHAGQRILVMGDMAELGAASAQLHRDVGACAQAANLDGFLCIGALSREAAEAFGAKAMHFDALELLAAYLRERLEADTTVLVKGSRSAGLDRLVSLLFSDGNPQRPPYAA